jgi:hypothetical protein
VTTRTRKSAKTTTAATGPDEARGADSDTAMRYCAQPPAPARPVVDHLTDQRANAILVGGTKWVNGTTLHYYFFDGEHDGEIVLMSDGTHKFVSWVGDEVQRGVVRRGFEVWADLGIGLRFVETDDRAKSEIRIAISIGVGGSWSAVGRDVLQAGVNDPTMHFGWNLDVPGHNGLDTAVHEIGHTIGFQHEHQNPFAGIVWDEPAVLDAFSKPPNKWDADKIRRNILDKFSTNEVTGSEFDHDSVMEYPFGPGLIISPKEYQAGLQPAGGLSAKDKEFVLDWYPSIAGTMPVIEPFQSHSEDLAAGGQLNLRLRPPASREYQIQTFGRNDTVMVLFEQTGSGEDPDDLVYLAGDDDAAQDRNAVLTQKLITGRSYVLRLRCLYPGGSGTVAVMYW